MTRRAFRIVANAAVRGAMGWSAFGLAEAGLGSALATAFPALALRLGSPWATTLLAALAYIAGGAAVGAVVGMARSSVGLRGLPIRTRPLVDLVVTLSVICAMNATLAFGAFGKRTFLLFAAGSLALGILVIWRATRPHGQMVYAFGSVWFVSLTSCGVLHLTLAAVGRGSWRWAMAAAAAWVVSMTGVTVVSVQRLAGITFSRERRVAGHLCAWSAILLLTLVGENGIHRAERAESAPHQANKPNVLLITMDTVRADHVSANGYRRQTTSHLGGLAQEAVLYTTAIATGNMTLTSHASIFTGRYASFHGALPPASPLPPGIPTLAEILGAAGYRTAGIVSNRVYLHPSMGLARGFQFYDYRLPDMWDAPGPIRLPRDVVAVAFWRLTSTGAGRPFYRPAGDITQAALQQIEASSGVQRPFFLFLNYMDAHTLYAPPPPYDSLFVRAPRPVSWPEYQAMKRDVITNVRRMTDDEHERLVGAYDGGIAYVDDEIGRLVAALRARNLFERTLVIVTSDHGEAFGEHGMVEHGASVYQHQIHVPLVVKFPGARSPEVVRDPVSVADLMPTILDVVGQGVPPGVQGRSLLRRGDGAPRYLFAEAFAPDGSVERAVFGRGGRKLIIDSAGKPRMFDVQADPGEQRDVLARFATDATMMRAAVRGMFGPYASRPTSDATPDADVLDRLRSLGYIR